MLAPNVNNTNFMLLLCYFRLLAKFELNPVQLRKFIYLIKRWKLEEKLTKMNPNHVLLHNINKLSSNDKTSCYQPQTSFYCHLNPKNPASAWLVYTWLLPFIVL